MNEVKIILIIINPHHFLCGSVCDNLEHLPLALTSAIMDKNKSFKIKEARQETQKGGCAKIRAKDPLGIPRKGDLGKS